MNLMDRAPHSQTLFDQAIFSVSELLELINETLKPLRAVVQGEVTSISNRGHSYFSLSDPKEQAKLDCILWRNKAQQLPFELKVGQVVQLTGQLNIYKPMGKLSFVVDKIAPVGEGALRQAFEQLKKQLEAKGFFATQRKRPIPEYPHLIGVLTSQQGDAIKDFVTHVGKFGLKIVHRDARVEGLAAIDSITAGLAWFNRQAKPIEVIVLTRGGGSLESLQAFNSLEVAQAIFASRIPVISAVGHENDVTIADLVADVRASTPTDAGKLLSQHWAQAAQKLDGWNYTIEWRTKQLWTQARQQLTAIWRQIESRTTHQLQQLTHILKMYPYEWQQTIVTHTAQYKQVMAGFIHGGEQYLTFMHNRWHRQHYQNRNQVAVVERVLSHWSDLFEYIWGQPLLRFEHQLNRWQTNIEHFKTQLQAADPDHKLKQGYSILFTQAGRVVKSIEQVHINDALHVKLHGGEIKSVVSKVLTKK